MTFERECILRGSDFGERMTLERECLLRERVCFLRE